jgi:PPOX class probable F420-dependent enzyme
MELDAARYFNLATFRRDGRAVETPVWFATDGATHYVFSAGNVGKVKRIRNSPNARVAPCDVRGRLTGAWQEARARLVTDPQEIARAYVALRRKYGLSMWITDVLAKIAGRYDKRAMIAVNLASGSTS